MKKQTKGRKPVRVNQIFRVRFLLFIALLILIGFLARLFYLQVFASDSLEEAALSQRRSVIEVKPKRGSIYDRNHRPLAVSVSVNTLYVFPREIREEDRAHVAETLSYILSLKKEEVEKTLASDRYEVLLKQKLTQEEMDQLNSTGIGAYRVVQEPERYYPNGDLLAQTLGFVNDDGEGVYGLESSYNALLQGSVGKDIQSTDLSGNIIPTESVERYASMEGNNLTLTIDLEVQKILNEELKRGINEFRSDLAIAILMDPNTGEILAMENYPSFDPNSPRAAVSGVDKTTWDAMPEEEQLNHLYQRWSNPAVSYLYEPGSVFKTLTTAIALETKSSTPDSRYVCTGKIEIAPGVYIHCWRDYDPHGVQTLEEALNNSCNPAFVQIVREIGKEAFYSYLQSLHMGGKTGVDLPAEESTLMPKTLEKLTSVQMATMSYGHGISVTPLQMMTAANATINGGYYRTPHLFSYCTTESGDTVSTYQMALSDPIFSQETVETMRKFLLSTAKATNSKTLRIQDMEIGVKSGTTLLLENGEYSEKTIASFYSCYPVKNPQYALLVVTHDPKTATYGSDVAGEISANILSRLISMQASGKTEGKETNRIPNVVGLTVEEAMKKLRDVGMEATLYGSMNDFSLVAKQSPEANSMQRVNTRVELRPDEMKTFRMPDLSGKTVAEAREMLSGAGLSFQLKGDPKGVIQKQTPSAGAEVPQNTAIFLEAQPLIDSSDSDSSAQFETKEDESAASIETKENQTTSQENTPVDTSSE